MNEERVMLENKSKNNRNEILILIAMILLALSSIALFILSVMKKSFSNVDLSVYWEALAKGIAGNRDNSLVMPYGRIIGNLVIPGYLSYTGARIYYFVEMAVVIFFIFREILASLRERVIFLNEKRRIIATICVIFIPWHWADALLVGNIGGILALFCILAAFYVKKHENIAAILLALAMIKPQIGLIFLFTLFLKRKFKLAFKVILIDVVGWVIYSVYSFFVMEINGMDTGILENLNDVINTVSGYGSNSSAQGTDEGAWYFYYGLFNPLISKGVPVYVVLVLSALTGAAFIVFFLYLFRKNKEISNDYVILFSITSLASLFWCYKSQSDAIVLILCNLMVLYLLALKNFDTKYSVMAVVILVLMNCIVCKYILRLLIPLFDYVEAILGDMLLQIISFSTVLFCIYCTKMKERRCV